ncbi:MAG: DivIVA domain-containing protein [Fimbriimonadales bacterium]|nr:DivIVA domain-containing protein [Fimbriimonadales bacterium]
MERIKPIDLERTPIRRAFRGYHRNTVDLLLGRASRTIEELLNEEQRLRAENERLKAELEQYRSLEATMKDALVLAQKAADETRAAAHKEAESILEKARLQARREQEDAAADIRRLNEEFQNLEREYRAFLGQYRSLLAQKLEELDRLIAGQTPAPAVRAAVAVPVDEESDAPTEEEAAVR